MQVRMANGKMECHRDQPALLAAIYDFSFYVERWLP